MPSQRDALRNIRTFPQLIKFLRDEMDWPIESENFEELTFDYTPEELGIDTASAAKIQEIKRLRPLCPGQPWGIFFVKFEPKRLPVVALRRVLSRVVLKKRASANSDERAAWQADDLLFISNYGEGDERQISFAHFSQHGEKADLPTLKVLGWDNRDTALHLDDVADTLHQQLAWPEDEHDSKGWRGKWQSAFTLRHGEVITTSKDLAVRLAGLARAIHDRIRTVLAIETDKGPVTKLMKAFQQALIHDLSADDFADMYAQTIAYGLLSARVANPAHDTADAVATHIPVTNPFLKELMETFLHLGGRKRKERGGNGIDFDELGVSEVVELLDAANMEAVVRDFGDRNRDEDPVIHFYELFLKEYDAKKRMQRGVFYTPQPVVSYIVRSVHELLQTEFGLEDGLASVATWGDIADKREGLKIPDGVKPTDPFVVILDPATGTATFLVEAIEVIHRTLTAKWKQQRLTDTQQSVAWNEYVPKNLLPRLHGFELMMAPYAIAHMKIGLKLYETGYRFGSEERARIYLTNALEPASDNKKQREFEEWVPALAHEAKAVNAVKRYQHFTVVIGNPPYSASISEPEWLMKELESWKEGLNETKIDLNREEWKFVRYGQITCAKNPIAILGYVVNRDFLDGVAKRRMRESLQETFPFRTIVDLNGDVKGNIADENVFEITQGVCVAVLCRGDGVEHRFFSLVGTRKHKYSLLSAKEQLDQQLVSFEPSAPYFRWVPFQGSGHAGIEAEYLRWLPLNEVFRVYSSGIQTKRDGLCVDFDEQVLWTRVRRLHALAAAAARKEFDLGDDGRDWTVAGAKADLAESGPNKRYVTQLLYRPFDLRYTYWTGKTKGFLAYPRRDVMQHVIGRKNFGMIFNRQIVGDIISHFGVSRFPICHGTFYLGNKGQDYFAPLFLSFGEDDLLSGFSSGLEANFTPTFSAALSQALGAEAKAISPEEVFQYAYATFYSPTYRSRYAELLKIDFPRLPLTRNLELLRALARVGAELVALHLLESPALSNLPATYTCNADPEIEKISHVGDTVWLDKEQTRGFHGVSEAVWNFQIGGYQVCEKWLKDRKGRTLSKDDVTHYDKIVVALGETVRLMKEIDALIEKHGGWPGAFKGAANDATVGSPEQRRRVITE